MWCQHNASSKQLEVLGSSDHTISIPWLFRPDSRLNSDATRPIPVWYFLEVFEIVCMMYGGVIGGNKGRLQVDLVLEVRPLVAFRAVFMRCEL